MYSCSQILFLKYELGWILTREPTVSEELVSARWAGSNKCYISWKICVFFKVDRALSVYKTNNIKLNLVVTEQKDSCVYEPPVRCIDEELPSNIIEGLLSTVRLYLRALFRKLASLTDKVNWKLSKARICQFCSFSLVKNRLPNRFVLLFQAKTVANTYVVTYTIPSPQQKEILRREKIISERRNFFRTKSAQQTANGPVWMPNVLCLIHF